LGEPELVGGVELGAIELGTIELEAVELGSCPDTGASDDDEGIMAGFSIPLLTPTYYSCGVARQGQRTDRSGAFPRVAFDSFGSLKYGARMRPRGNASHWLAAVGVLVSASTTCRPAFSAGRIGLNGQPIQTSQYSIDLHQGAVVSGNRVMGLGGAYVALAEDVDGDLQNPAAPALRPFYSVEYFDYWLGLGLTFPGRLSNSDFFNSGSVTKFEGSSDDAVFVTPALNLQWAAFGLSLTAELQSYSLRNPALPGSAQSASLEALLATYHLQFAYSFLDGQLATGVGIRYLTLEFDAGTDDDATRTLFDTSGSGIEIGAVWRPNLRPYRLGLAFRTEINTEPAFSRSLLPSPEGDILLTGAEGTLYLPERVSLPWDLNLGAAVQFGKRPLNPVSRTVPQVAERAALTFRLRQLERDEERERRMAGAVSASEREVIERELAAEEARESSQLERDFKQARRALAESSAMIERFYLLVTASLVISGAVEDAVGVESFLEQTVNRSGTQVVYSPRLGVESEVWEDRLKLRGGSYLEPSRFSTSHSRVHGTLGADLRLFRWDVFGLWPDDFNWQIGGSLDVARSYLSWGVSVAGWYPRSARGEVRE